MSASRPPFSRRALFKGISSGFGYVAFAGMLTMAGAADRVASPLAPKAPHISARARRVIFHCMHGAPSHGDTFDYKPRLSADVGKRSPAGQLAGARLLGSPWAFRQHGRSGQWISDLFPEVAGHADELCQSRRMQSDLSAQTQDYMMMYTGSFEFIRPSLGAWTLHGLVTENEDLPGFLAIRSVSPTTPATPGRSTGRSPAC